MDAYFESLLFYPLRYIWLSGLSLQSDGMVLKMGRTWELSLIKTEALYLPETPALHSFLSFELVQNDLA